MTTKIYVDGFKIDEIDTPKLCDDLKSVAMTDAVKELLEGRAVTKFIAVPKTNPKFIIVETEL